MYSDIRGRGFGFEYRSEFKVMFLIHLGYESGDHVILLMIKNER
jgi:hypothetical protein